MIDGTSPRGSHIRGNTEEITAGFENLYGSDNVKAAAAQTNAGSRTYLTPEQHNEWANMVVDSIHTLYPDMTRQEIAETVRKEFAGNVPELNNAEADTASGLAFYGSMAYGSLPGAAWFGSQFAGSQMRDYENDESDQFRVMTMEQATKIAIYFEARARQGLRGEGLEGNLQDLRRYRNTTVPETARKGYVNRTGYYYMSPNTVQLSGNQGAPPIQLDGDSNTYRWWSRATGTATEIPSFRPASWMPDVRKTRKPNAGTSVPMPF